MIVIYSININLRWLCMVETIVTMLFFVKGVKARARVMNAAGGLTRGGSVWGARGLRETSQHTTLNMKLAKVSDTKVTKNFLNVFFNISSPLFNTPAWLLISLSA